MDMDFVLLLFLVAAGGMEPASELTLTRKGEKCPASFLSFFMPMYGSYASSDWILPGAFSDLCCGERFRFLIGAALAAVTMSAMLETTTDFMVRYWYKGGRA